MHNSAVWNFCQKTLILLRISGSRWKWDHSTHVHVTVHVTHHFPVFMFCLCSWQTQTLVYQSLVHGRIFIFSCLLPASVPQTTLCTAVLILFTPNKSISWRSHLLIRSALHNSTSHLCLHWDLSSVRFMGGECDGIRMDESAWSHVVHSVMPLGATRSCNKNILCLVFLNTPVSGLDKSSAVSIHAAIYADYFHVWYCRPHTFSVTFAPCRRGAPARLHFRLLTASLIGRRIEWPNDLTSSSPLPVRACRWD